MKTLTAEQVVVVIEALLIAAQNREDVGEPAEAERFDVLRKELSRDRTA